MNHKIIVNKIIKYIDKILGYTNNCTYESFCENTMLVEACVFNLSQIGELANKLMMNLRKPTAIFHGVFYMD